MNNRKKPTSAQRLPSSSPLAPSSPFPLTLASPLILTPLSLIESFPLSNALTTPLPSAVTPDLASTNLSIPSRSIAPPPPPQKASSPSSASAFFPSSSRKRKNPPKQSIPERKVEKDLGKFWGYIQQWQPAPSIIPPPASQKDLKPVKLFALLEDPVPYEHINNELSELYDLFYTFFELIKASSRDVVKNLLDPQLKITLKHFEEFNATVQKPSKLVKDFYSLLYASRLMWNEDGNLLKNYGAFNINYYPVVDLIEKLEKKESIQTLRK